MPKKTQISEQDQTLFREMMRDVKPLAHTKMTAPKPVIKPIVKNKTPLEEEKEDDFSDFEHLEAVGGEDIIQFSRPGIQHKILRNLRNGKYNVEVILDLHGMTIIEARQALSHFLLKCQQHGTRHILIIHGKGHHTNNKPILKNKLNHWLRQTEQVLAFCSATNRDGRGGALYVLLKTSLL